jgi:hypothetical protein
MRSPADYRGGTLIGGMSHDEAILPLWLERVPRVLTTDKRGLKAMRTWRPLTLAAVLTAEEAGART